VVGYRVPAVRAPRGHQRHRNLCRASRRTQL